MILAIETTILYDRCSLFVHAKQASDDDVLLISFTLNCDHVKPTNTMSKSFTLVQHDRSEPEEHPTQSAPRAERRGRCYRKL